MEMEDKARGLGKRAKVRRRERQNERCRDKDRKADRDRRDLVQEIHRQ